MKADTLLTPSLDLPILAGVTRGLLLEAAERETVEGVFPLDQAACGRRGVRLLLDP